MAIALVSLGPALRAWSQAGMTHILCDEPVAAFIGDFGQTAQETRLVATTPLPTALPQARTPTPSRKEAVDTAASERTAESGTLASKASGGAKPHSVGYLTLSRSDGVPNEPNHWPFSWADRIAKSVQAPILWTYHELGTDLLGAGSPERSTFFKSLIGDLRLPRGSSVFWPSAMPPTNQNAPARLEANPAVYAAGVRRLNPQVMVVFGDKAIEDMGLAGRVKKFRQEMVEGRLLLALPDIEELLRQPRQRQSAVSLLRAVLASVNFS